jgi:hypothetical protein
LLVFKTLVRNVFRIVPSQARIVPYPLVFLNPTATELAKAK